MHGQRKPEATFYIRRIAGLNAIDDAIGRATEMGRPILMVPGIGDLDAVSVQAVNIFAQVTRRRRSSPPRSSSVVRGPRFTLLLKRLSEDVYSQQGMSDRYSIDSVQYISDQQFAFAAGVSGDLSCARKLRRRFFSLMQNR
ncbi:MAG: DUF6754 domain-containing protein [Fimbriimonadaceae bacterium]